MTPSALLIILLTDYQARGVYWHELLKLHDDVYGQVRHLEHLGLIRVQSVSCSEFRSNPAITVVDWNLYHARIRR
jgi:hypothetical protein